MTTNQEAQSMEETLDSTLEKTDLGHIINENKKAVLAAAAVIIIALLGYVVVSKIQASKHQEMLAQAYQVETSVFEPYLTDKIKADEFVTKLNSLDPVVFEDVSIYASLLAGLEKLHTDGKLTTDLMDKAQTWLDKQDKRSDVYLLAGLGYAALWEDLGNNDKALAIYENLIKRSNTLLKDKIFFNAGRMYMKKGDKENATKHFEYLFKEHKDSYYAKMARLYLSEL